MRTGEFDFGEGERQKEKGMARARGNQSNVEFNHSAQQFFFGLKLGDVFTPDDLVRYTGLPGDGSQGSANAVGSWFSGMYKAGFIKPTGRWVRSERIIRHADENKEWIKIKG
jgi:hypothetical protein